MADKKQAQIGKTYESTHGSSKGEVGKCIEAWETGFGHRFVKLKTPAGIRSLREIDVKRYKAKKKEKT